MLQCWEGNNYIQTRPHILVLGESHYEGDNIDEYVGLKVRDGKTQSVVNYYLGIKDGSHERVDGEKYNWTSFFTKISKSFSYEKVDDFYNKILFANYIDKYCGIKTSSAGDFLAQLGYREHCNDELFELINEKQVDVIICFSRLAYDNLPSMAEGEYEKAEILSESENGRKNRAGFCKYLNNTVHNHCNVLLWSDLKVYCIPHPSSVGYSTTVVQKYLDEKNLLF